jgi:hypothetical protein
MTKKTPLDTVQVTLDSTSFKTRKAFVEAVNEALPDVGQWEYIDHRKAFGFVRIAFHPEIAEGFSEHRRDEAKFWLETVEPILEAKGLPVLSARVSHKRTTDWPGIWTSVKMTKEYWTRINNPKV